ncbi:Protein of unknown function (DUF3024) [Nitrosospira sp. Nsp5]|uniref:DUF3024 domain-containing protein n=1 Tax=Nitrosospira multiformis TaxID=1231 RepID=A0ABY0TGM1_9PROT|nr:MULTISPECIES: DUF3024 domain-containing protein [Nitrosospira]PTR10590.1 Protein of unknown function (DUF3024) [Nitrosospira sp. Nsp5]SDQ80163.1 Protein of unknown function [Nitrosospira multiformis]
MPLSEFERVRIEKLFKAYCESKVPAHVRNKIQITFKIRGSEVKLFECRPHFDDPATWGEMAVARFKKDEKKNVWFLYCADRNSRWYLFEPYPESRDIARLLAEVQRDQTGIFWG